MGYYQYAIVPGSYYSPYSTPPPSVYPAPVYSQVLQTVQASPQLTQRPLTYTTALPGTPTHVTTQMQDMNHPIQQSHQVITGHTPVAHHAQIMEPPTIVQTSNRQRVVIWNYCQFCQNNREPESFYKSHILRDSEGKVVCPVLRAYNCPICNNGGGDMAHTKSYCPQLRSSGRLARRSHSHQ